VSKFAADRSITSTWVTVGCEICSLKIRVSMNVYSSRIVTQVLLSCQYPDYGSEWDLMIKKPFAERFSVVLKYADYDSRSFSTDTQKLWVMFAAGFGN